MSQKTIQFNSEFLSMSGSKNKTLKKPRKEKPIITMNPNKVKKQLIEKIKTFQLKEKEIEVKEKIKEEEEKINIEKEFNNDFTNSVKFLEELAKKEKDKDRKKREKREKPKNDTLKRGKIENEIKMQIETELPPEMKIPFKSSSNQKVVYSLNSPQAPAQAAQQVSVPQVLAPKTQAVLAQAQATQAQATQAQATQAQATQAQATQAQATQAPAPQYSNLKNSTLPTFRQWKNSTQKNYNTQPNKPSIKIDDYMMNNEPSDRSIALENIKNSYKNINTNNTNNENIENNENNENNILEETPILNNQIPKKRRHRITKTRKYTLGRKGDKVSVLIKNAKTRKLVQHELALLRQKGIPEIKTFLRKKNLLKVGSDAPNDVLRQIYEQSILSGDVENKAKDVLIHNYMNH
jgi:hypothetical protein